MPEHPVLLRPRSRRTGRPRRWITLASLLTGLALGGVAGCGTAPSAPVSDHGGAGTARETAGPAVVRADRTPKGLDVPSIGVHTSGLVTLGLTPSGTMEVPHDAVTAGWFDLGPVPGEPGPAVIAAHVNYRKVDGVFARLHEMAVGDTATVVRADGRTVTFTAYRVARYAKSAFPTQEVYGDTAGPELRLVTCGGDFDQATGHYRDNVVVFAREN
jgi:hypothetical protein